MIVPLDVVQEAVIQMTDYRMTVFRTPENRRHTVMADSRRTLHAVIMGEEALKRQVEKLRERGENIIVRYRATHRSKSVRMLTKIGIKKATAEKIFDSIGREN